MRAPIAKAQPLHLTWAQFGEIVNVTTVATMPHWILHRCAHARVGFFCVTCREHLANGGQLEMHIEMGGSHHIATNCPRHGYEVGEYPDLVQLQAL